MRSPGQADCLVVVNGPEDGTEFPLVRTPFHIGNDSGCTVNLRLDKGVEDFHALVTAVSDGYRIRKTDERPIYVDGRPAGTFRSRIVRNGGMVQVGQTLLVLDCSPDGLARRSRGIVSETDFGWAIQEATKKIWTAAQGAASFVYRIARRILTSWTAVLALLFLAYVFYTPFRSWVYFLFWSAWYRIEAAFTGR